LIEKYDNVSYFYLFVEIYAILHIEISLQDIFVEKQRADKRFDDWNEVKKRTHKSERKIGIKPREIFWMRIGHNVGTEEFGKGRDFVRPVIIVRRLTHDLFLGIPTTTAPKDKNDYFYPFCYREKIHNRSKCVTAMILQVRTYSIKRLLNKIGTVQKDDFVKIQKRLQRLIDPASQEAGVPEGELRG